MKVKGVDREEVFDSIRDDGVLTSLFIDSFFAEIKFLDDLFFGNGGGGGGGGRCPKALPMEAIFCNDKEEEEVDGKAIVVVDPVIVPLFVLLLLLLLLLPFGFSSS